LNGVEHARIGDATPLEHFAQSPLELGDARQSECS
jgi:hypothetical protein